jgi:hypothetical protein
MKTSKPARRAAGISFGSATAAIGVSVGLMTADSTGLGCDPGYVWGQQPGIPIGPGASGRTQHPAAADNTMAIRMIADSFDIT